MHATLPEIDVLIEEEWSRHISDNYLWLSKIPSSEIAVYCHVFQANPEKYNVEFLSKKSRWLLSEEEKDDLWNEYLKERSDRERMSQYEAFSDIKRRFKYQIDHLEPAHKDLKKYEEIWNSISIIDTPKSTEIRKVLKPMLKNMFDTKLVSHGGSSWKAPLSVNNLPISLDFDFGGFSRGFRYSLTLPLQTEGHWRAYTSYEDVLGFNTPPWDLLRTDILSEQLVQLSEVITKMLSWLSLVDWSTKKLSIESIAIEK